MGIEKHGYAHRNKKSKLYVRWIQMRKRCNNQNADDYKHYGGRGIKVCSEWDDFSKFREWAIANGYSEELQIDRIDNNREYSPDNCRWVTRSKNMSNRRTFKNSSTGYTGIYRDTSSGKYFASIDRSKKRFYLGRYESIQDAAKARKGAMKVVEYYESVIVDDEQSEG